MVDISRQARRRMFASAVVLTAVVLAGCGSDDDASEVVPAFELTTSEMGEEDAARMVAIADGTVAEDPSNLGHSTPGYLYGVWDPERGVNLVAAGVSDIEGGTAMAPDMSFRIASITKTFTATAVLLLVDDGKVDLDEPVATYTGDLTADLPGGDTVTVRQLLEMKSGFPEYAAGDPEGPFIQQLREPDHEFTAEELVAAAATGVPTSTDEVTYVNTNYIVLGRLIEEASGGSYGDFVKERILDPVGLDDTIIPDPTVTAPVESHGYLNEDWADFPEGVVVPADVAAAGSSGDDVTDMSTSVGGSAGNGVSTLQDLATWAAADFGNVLLSDSSRQARLAGNPADLIIPGSEYGLGLQILGNWHFHGGQIFGWESPVFANPTTGQVVVVNANVCCGLAVANILNTATTFPDDPDLATLQAALQGG